MKQCPVCGSQDFAPHKWKFCSEVCAKTYRAAYTVGYNRKLYQRDSLNIRAKSAAYYESNKTAVAKVAKLRRLLKSDEIHLSKVKAKYGISKEHYYFLLDKQQGVCAICGQQESNPNKARLSVDHCHSTGKVRGLLCTKCNQGLGLFQDSLELLDSAKLYLTEYTSLL